MKTKKMYKILTACLIAIFVISSLFLISSCNEKSYGTFEMKNTLNYRYEYNKIEEYNFVQFFERASLVPFHFSEESYKHYNFEILGSRRLGDDVTVNYVIDDVKNVNNPVIVSKWIYLYSLYQSARQFARDNYYQGGLTAVISQEDWKNIQASDYCLEQASIFNMAYRSEKFETSLVDIYNQINILFNMAINLPDGNKNPEVKEIKPLWEKFYSIKHEFLDIGITWEVAMAALCKYGVIEFEANKIGQLFIEKDDRIVELNVVGFFETEADILLTTGVPMDKEDLKYQTVMEQVKNPKIYSVRGNIFD